MVRGQQFGLHGLDLLAQLVDMLADAREQGAGRGRYRLFVRQFGQQRFHLRRARDYRHGSVHLFGAICPARGICAAIIMSAVNTEAMNHHLKEISTQVATGAHALLVCDGAGWHQPGQRLIVPANITLMPLPPYAPELNPMENVWDYLRGNKLSARVWDSYDAIMAACVEAWNFIANDPKRITSIGSRAWACVKG